MSDAYEKLMGGEYANSLYRSFEKTCCLITADGSDDSKINPEGLPGYILPPPLPTPAKEEAIQCEVPQPDEEVPDDGDEYPTPYVYNTMRKLQMKKMTPDQIEMTMLRVGFTIILWTNVKLRCFMKSGILGKCPGTIKF